MIFGLSGKKRVGKSTTTAFIQEMYPNVISYALASPIKQAIYDTLIYMDNKELNILNITFEDIDGQTQYNRENILTENRELFGDIIYETCYLIMQNYCKNEISYNSKGKPLSREIENIIEESLDNYQYSIRSLMQIVGTDIFVNHIDVNFWNKIMMNTYFDSNKDFSQPVHFVITDVRQSHEIGFLRSINAPILHILKPDANQDTDNHITEQALPIAFTDYVIDNSFTLDILKENIKYKMDNILILKVD